MEQVISLHQNKSFKHKIKNIYDMIKRNEVELPYHIDDDGISTIIDKRKDGSLFIKSMKHKRTDSVDTVFLNKKVKKQVKEFAKNNMNILPIVINTSSNDDGVFTRIHSYEEDGELTFKFQEIEKKLIKTKVNKNLKYKYNKFGRGLTDGPGISKSTTSISIDPVEFEDLTMPKPEVSVVKNKVPVKKIVSEKDFFKKSKSGWKPKASSTTKKTLDKSIFNVKKREKFTTIMVNNMPEDITEDELRDIFKDYGRVKYVNLNERKKRIDRERVTIVTGFINFSLEQEAKKAFKALNGVDKHKTRFRSCILQLKLISNKK